MAGLVNLFDLAMVFAVALMVAVVSYMNVPELWTQESFTMVKNAGREDMEIVVKDGQSITRFTPEEGGGEGQGRRIGVAYELDNGEVIYVPE
ncbi:MAG: DUF2149 domain-containing protein [Proteobacteria bacterium]|nr:DUF2149 domain-containing protein [Pseudomonadota bacterium]MCP4918495.1 DUF2149 domain-containing protein [Pseudomonadota bacterium]